MQVFYFVIDLLRYLRACLHGGGGPQVGEVTHLGGGNPPVHIICQKVTPPIM